MVLFYPIMHPIYVEANGMICFDAVVTSSCIDFDGNVTNQGQENTNKNNKLVNDSSLYVRSSQ